MADERVSDQWVVAVRLTEDERRALVKAAQEKRRHWGPQAARYVREGLERDGFLEGEEG